MSYPDLDLNLTDEEKALRDVMRKFGSEVVRPAGIELDKMEDPADTIAEGSVLWDVFRKYRELGFHRRGFAKELGGISEDMGPLGSVLIGEELGYADAGLAISLGVSSMGFNFLPLFPDPEFQELIKEFLEDLDCTMIGCWAITEPDHGSDWILAADRTFMDPKTAPSMRAVLDGDEYVLNGQKSAWVSDGTIATHASLHVSLDPSRGMQGTGLAFVPLDLPGISKGKPLDKIGQRALNQGEIFFDNVRIPQKYMLVPDPEIASQMGLMSMILTGANTGMSVTFAGLARAAFDEALHYARERVQGGKPIIEHQNIKLKLMDMFTRVEASRSLSRRTSLYNAANPPGSPQHAVAAKVLSTESAFKVASEAVQVFGGNGLSREYVIEKMFRDARASMIEDGANEALSITAATFFNMA